MSVRQLTRFEKVNYSLGSTAEAIAFTAASSFLLLFYNQVRGLPAGVEKQRRRASGGGIHIQQLQQLLFELPQGAQGFFRNI